MWKTLMKRFWREQEGLELSEYAVMVALICLVIIVAVLSLGPVIAGKFDSLRQALESAP